MASNAGEMKTLVLYGRYLLTPAFGGMLAPLPKELHSTRIRVIAPGRAWVIILFTLNLLTTGLLLPTSSLARPIIDAAEFGLNALPPGADATPVFRSALEACRKRNASGLKIPAGNWHLYPDQAYEQTLPVANNDPGIKRVVFALDGLKGFTLEGSGARFICHGEMIPISSENSHDLKLHGFTIDWDRPFNFQGRVIAAHPQFNAFDLAVHDEVIYEIRGQRLVFMGKPSRTPDSWKEWAPPTTEFLTWQQNLQWNMWFDEKTRSPIPGEHLWGLKPDPRVEEIRPRVLRIFDALNQLPATGMILTVNGMMEPNRTSPAIRISRCANLLLEDVTIHHAGGMGVIVQRTDGATLRRLQVILEPGKNRYVTTTADATHFNGCRGCIVLEDCTFENMLDDAANIHGCFVRIEKQLGPATLLCRRIHSEQRGLIVAERGDRIRFVTSRDLQPYGDAKVVATRELNWDLFEVTLDRVPEGGVKPASGIYNLTWQPKLVVSGCAVRNNRARTMLIATAGDVLIEKNLFTRSSMAGIQFEGDNGFWWEAGPTRKVVIRDNLFADIYGAVLRIVPTIDAGLFPNALYHGGIVFESNTIKSFHRTLVEGTAVDGLVIRSNTISQTDTFSNTDVTTPSFSFKSGRNIVIENNTFTGHPALLAKAAMLTAKPVMRNNLGIVTPAE